MIERKEMGSAFDNNFRLVNLLGKKQVKFTGNPQVKPYLRLWFLVALLVAGLVYWACSPLTGFFWKVFLFSSVVAGFCLLLLVILFFPWRAFPARKSDLNFEAVRLVNGWKKIATGVFTEEKSGAIVYLPGIYRVQAPSAGRLLLLVNILPTVPVIGWKSYFEKAAENLGQSQNYYQCIYTGIYNGRARFLIVPTDRTEAV